MLPKLGIITRPPNRAILAPPMPSPIVLPTPMRSSSSRWRQRIDAQRRRSRHRSGHREDDKAMHIDKAIR